ncbi:neuronal pentraxin-2-like [Pocillopora verrucosa]|uniref:neuronal pentraxin-2-like n=1 Tax=Pocillopora verrucosa TaxID=203993 RepID=UPI003342679F
MTQSYQQTSALSVAMFAAKSIRFYLLLIFVASPDISSSTRVNKTVSDGKVFITGDHNEVVLSSARETKLELAEIKNKLKLLSESNEDLSNLLHAMNLTLTDLEKQVAGYTLQFPQKGTTDYVIITRGMPNLSAVTVCLWIKTADTGNEGTPLSYAVSGGSNELLLVDYRQPPMVVVFINNHRSGATSVSANDGKWHHICLTWENTAGSWKLFRDGSVAASGKSLQRGYVIRANGSLVLGQEQDSKGGSFDANQSFIGEMTGVNIWDHVLKDQETARMSKSCLTGMGNVFQWREFKAHIKGSVKIIKPSC